MKSSYEAELDQVDSSMEGTYRLTLKGEQKLPMPEVQKGYMDIKCFFFVSIPGSDRRGWTTGKRVRVTVEELE